MTSTPRCPNLLVGAAGIEPGTGIRNRPDNLGPAPTGLRADAGDREVAVLHAELTDVDGLRTADDGDMLPTCDCLDC